MNYNVNYKRNLGDKDRVIRFVIGVFLLFLVYDRKLQGTKGTWAAMIGASQIVESIIGYCIVYDLLGWSTRKRENIVSYCRMYGGC